MEEEILLIDRKEQIVTMIFNRPEKANTFTPVLLIKIHQALEEFSKDDNIRCIIFRGAGEKSFSAGYDIGAIPTKIDPEIKEMLENQNPLELALRSVKNYPYPTIAMLNGYVYGAGFNMAACCDIRIAVEDARMSMPPAKLGLVYHPEGLQQFIDAYGLSMTKQILLTAHTYRGEELVEKNLVDYRIPREKFESFTYDYAEKITHNAPLSLKGMKKIINMLGTSMTLTDDQKKEAEAIIHEGFNSDDLKEGQLAFIEKRKPNFTGK